MTYRTGDEFNELEGSRIDTIKALNFEEAKALVAATYTGQMIRLNSGDIVRLDPSIMEILQVPSRKPKEVPVG